MSSGIEAHRLKAVVAALLLAAFWTLPCAAQELPIRIDASQQGAVFLRSVGQEEGYRKVSDTVPISVTTQPGERLDIKVRGYRNWWTDWQGEQQGRIGPANITVRLEPVPSWQRLSLSTLLLALVLGSLIWHGRRRTTNRLTKVQDAMEELHHRVKKAESVGSIPQRLGRFRILRELGKGGMGIVYLGEDADGWQFALKVPQRMDARAMREAEIMTGLQSPHIVRYFGLETCPENHSPPHLVLEYLEGETLHDRLRRQGRFPLKTLERLVEHLLNGLDDAHQLGVVHRDLKPSNIFLAGPEGKETLKIMDFGLATDQQESDLTRTGEMLGTPSYAAPEQMQGTPLDHRADLFSTGVILYEMATGILPWNCTEPLMLLKQKLEVEPKPPSLYRSELPQSWNKVILALLQADPNQRPPSVAEVRVFWLDK